MIEISMTYGHCEDSGAASFACVLATVLDNIDEGSDWGNTALSLMNLYNKQILIPHLHSVVYGYVLFWTGEHDFP